MTKIVVAILIGIILLYKLQHNTFFMINKTKKESRIQMLPFLYTNKIGMFLKQYLTTGWFNNVAGNYCNTALSKIHIPSFIAKHGINIDEAEKKVHEFTCFNDFFIRKLKSDARPIDNNPTSIICPADGTLLAIEHLTDDMAFPIKGTNFCLTRFLQNKQLSEQFMGGTIVIVRLAPWDYHRFHFPCDCIPGSTVSINGSYESVNPLVYRSGIQPLHENERHLIVLQTNHTQLLFVSVGALCVGTIKETYEPLQQYKKGSEIGYFCFGGSTIALIFAPSSVKLDNHFLENSYQGIETPVKMGQKIGISIN